jgi:hypothetical protein
MLVSFGWEVGGGVGVLQLNFKKRGCFLPEQPLLILLKYKSEL